MDYVYEQAGRAGKTREVLPLLEGERIAKGVEAIFNEASGVTNNTTLKNILNGFTTDELKKIEKVWQRLYQRSYGGSFEEMITGELETADAQVINNRLQGVLENPGAASAQSQPFDAATQHDNLLRAMRVAGSGRTGSTLTVENLNAVEQILTTTRQSGNLSALNDYFTQHNNNKPLADFVYDRMTLIGKEKEAVRWLEGDRAADGVEAIFHEANGWTSNTTLKNLLETYANDLPAIRRAWDRAYRRHYTMGFDAMLDYELGSAVAAQFKESPAQSR